MPAPICLSTAETETDNDRLAPRRGGREVDRVFETMVEEIVSGVMAPGMKLREPDLARRFGISRGPLREAIRRLQERELVVCTPNAGARVIIHSPREILEAYEIREALEGMAARLAAKNMSDEEIVALRKAFEEEAARGKSGGYHNDFHMMIVRGSHNNRLLRLLNEDSYRLLKLWRTHYSWLRYGGQESWRDHLRVLEAIEQRDGELAELLMRRHIARLRKDSTKNLQEMQVTAVAE